MAEHLSRFWLRKLACINGERMGWKLMPLDEVARAHLRLALGAWSVSKGSPRPPRLSSFARLGYGRR